MIPPNHCAPTELWDFEDPGVYKRFIPTGLICPDPIRVKACHFTIASRVTPQLAVIPTSAFSIEVSILIMADSPLMTTNR